MTPYNLTATEIAKHRALGPLPQGSDADIDYSDIPAASARQLASLRPVPTRTAISLRIDADVLAALRAAAEARGIGYQTYINAILGTAARQHEKRTSR